MRKSFSKIALAATFGLALAFTFSCSSSDDSPPPDNGGGSSPSQQEQYVFCKLNAGTCSQMSLSTCMELVNAGVAQIVSNCNAEPPPPSSNSNGNYCDYGWEGGCYPMDTEEDRVNCALWGTVVRYCNVSSSSSTPSSSSSSATVCGSVSYNPTTEQCCGDSKYTIATQICDTRDNKKYKYVKIGTQIWMAENLNYNTSGSKCYDNSNANTIYGRLYDWATAMAISTTYNSASYSASAKHKGVCPTGWHLPSGGEWTTLTDYVGTNAGTKLKANSGWDWDSYNGQSGNGTDAFGFAALPGGFGSGGDFFNDGIFGSWWSIEEDDNYDAFGRYMYFNSKSADIGYYEKSDLFSVRCLRD